MTINDITTNELGTYRATARNVFGSDSAESEVGRGSKIDFNSGDQLVVSDGEYKVGTNLILDEPTEFTIIAEDIDGVPPGTITWDLAGIERDLFFIS
ncbi:hypothetical protein, partial [Salmonella sp. s51228]|uniref:hypothetical protein n=1 Tax=Salmonella sp. s51228 TaxID=3159652 RepID=UPI0039818B05